MSFHADTVASLREGDEVTIEHDPANEYDANACAVTSHSGLVGHLPREIAARMVAGRARRWRGRVEEILPGQNATGVRIKILEAQATAQPAAVEPERTGEDRPADEATPTVYVTARSGRVLGTLIRQDGAKTLVMTDSGPVPYPSELVTLTTPAAQ